MGHPIYGIIQACPWFRELVHVDFATILSALPLLMLIVTLKVLENYLLHFLYNNSRLQKLLLLRNVKCHFLIGAVKNVIFYY